MKEETKKKALSLMSHYNKGTLFKVKDKEKYIQFARQTIKDLKEIEETGRKELVEELKSLVWINNIYGQISLNDLERIQLIEMELTDRNIDWKPITKWYEQAKKKFEQETEEIKE